MNQGKTMSNPQDILNRLTGDFKRLALLIGIENALKVAEEFGGLSINIPKLAFIKKEKRDKQIRDDYDQKTPVRQLTMRYGLTQRRIYDILGEKKRGANASKVGGEEKYE